MHCLDTSISSLDIIGRHPGTTGVHIVRGVFTSEYSTVPSNRVAIARNEWLPAYMQ